MCKCFTLFVAMFVAVAFGCNKKVAEPITAESPVPAVEASGLVVPIEDATKLASREDHAVRAAKEANERADREAARAAAAIAAAEQATKKSEEIAASALATTRELSVAADRSRSMAMTAMSILVVVSIAFTAWLVTTRQQVLDVGERVKAATLAAIRRQPSTDVTAIPAVPVAAIADMPQVQESASEESATEESADAEPIVEHAQEETVDEFAQSTTALPELTFGRIVGKRSRGKS